MIRRTGTGPHSRLRLLTGTIVPVKILTKVTAVGTLELWCHERDGAGKWKLELNVRE